jgi:hypothetical protein
MVLAIDFYNEILDRLGWPQLETIEDPNLTTRHRKLLRVGERAIKAMGNLNDWPMLRTAGSLVFVAAEQSDTTVVGSEQYVTATQNSDTITVANKTFDDTYIGRAITFHGSTYVYEIIGVPSANQLQLHRAYVQTSITTADKVTFVIAMDRYAMPADFDRLADKMSNVFNPITIEPLDPRAFSLKRRVEPGIALGDPQVMTVYGLNTGETNQLGHFHPWPKEARLISFDYQRTHPTITSNNDKLLYPDAAVHVLLDAVLEIVNSDLEADDSKMTRVLERRVREYNQQQTHAGPTAPRLELRAANQFRQDALRFRRYGVRINWGDYWDRASEILPW